MGRELVVFIVLVSGQTGHMIMTSGVQEESETQNLAFFDFEHAQTTQTAQTSQPLENIGRATLQYNLHLISQFVWFDEPR